jgi:hypothetical protein
MPRGGQATKLTITIDSDLQADIVSAAAEEGISVSAWINGVARQALGKRSVGPRANARRRAGLAAVAEWEKEHGAFTPEAKEESRRRVRAQMAISRRAERRGAIAVISIADV